nr:immunoglobulin heavy chain junction region [Mus musculus]
CAREDYGNYVPFAYW